MNKGGYHHPQLIDEDVETFKSKLEASILSFKNDALKDFMGIKRNMLKDQSNTIDNERNKYNALLSSKQNEIENLKEQLAVSNKRNEDLTVRCEILALMAGKNKQLTKLKVSQYKAFKALKNYAGFKKHTKNVLEMRARENKLKMKRKVFQGWGKHWKSWKIQKDKEDFDCKLKDEMSVISAQYSKEIDTLRKQLNEARDAINTYEKTKMMTQENLKKAFMKGVCAMNMEAMTILNPNDQSDMEKKFESLAEGVFSESTPIRQLAFNGSNNGDYQAYDSNVKEEEVFKRFGINMSDAHESEKSIPNSSVQNTPSQQHRTENHQYTNEKEIKVERNAYTELDTASMSKPYNKSSAVKINRTGDDIVINNSKIESKDNAWKPAPVMNHEPQIINNVSNSASFGYKNNSISYNNSIPMPKHTLGVTNYMNQNNNSGLNNSSFGVGSNTSFMNSFQQISRPQNNNLDLEESMAPQPQPFPDNRENGYQHYKQNSKFGFRIK